ncbi:rCG61848 [Rattus norvegicus]|uniref:RCG61848 n=1 Tax=Rattus norvegicus TaxID=10116 RepID=A6H9N3_RAT|nr:rCG61848 [Rattus norvegicus]
MVQLTTQRSATCLFQVPSTVYGLSHAVINPDTWPLLQKTLPGCRQVCLTQLNTGCLDPDLAGSYPKGLDVERRLSLGGR